MNDSGDNNETFTSRDKDNIELILSNNIFKQIILYVPVFVFALLVFIRWYGKKEPVRLLLWESITIFGYLAAVSDLKYRKIENRLITIIACAWVITFVPQLYFRTEAASYEMFDSVVAFLLCAFMMTVIYLVSRKGIGGGDVKFIAVSSMYLGTSHSFSALLYGSILASVFCVILLALKKTGLKDAIPLVPFLYVGIFITILVG